MNWNMMNVWLMIFWTCVGLGLLFRRHLLGDDIRDSEHYDLLGFVALGLAVWNLARWQFTRSVRKSREAFERDRAEREARQRAEEGEKPVTDPQLDFTRNRPSDSNGDGR